MQEVSLAVPFQFNDLELLLREILCILARESILGQGTSNHEAAKCEVDTEH